MTLQYAKPKKKRKQRILHICLLATHIHLCICSLNVTTHTNAYVDSIAYNMPRSVAFRLFAAYLLNGNNKGHETRRKRATGSRMRFEFLNRLYAEFYFYSKFFVFVVAFAFVDF